MIEVLVTFIIGPLIANPDSTSAYSVEELPSITSCAGEKDYEIGRSGEGN